MCGIAGSFSRDVSAHSLAHRGPDGYHAWSNGRLKLQHWRLRILDLSERADQPMVSDDGALVLVFNGEIYNAEELKRRYFDGVAFRTTSDTEVMLRMLQRFGSAAVEHLRGMFAFALWRQREQRLVLGRDSFGIKPMLYAETHDGVHFASELPCLVRGLPSVPPPDLDALDLAFTYGFVPAPYTAFRGVRKLEPGEMREYDAEGRFVSRSVLPRPWLQQTAAHRQGQRSIRELIISAVGEQFYADVPVGVFLSGGIDSNVIVAAARQARVPDLETFTVRFIDPLEGDSNDETADARRSAEFFKTHHTEVDVRLGGAEDLLEDLDRFGEPFSNPTVYLTHLLSREARKQVTVALAGVGGDELFGGYPRYAALRHLRLIRGPLGRLAALTANAAARRMGSKTSRAVRRIAWAVGSGSRSPLEAYLEWAYYLGGREKGELLPGIVNRAARGTSDRVAEILHRPPFASLTSAVQDDTAEILHRPPFASLTSAVQDDTRAEILDRPSFASLTSAAHDDTQMLRGPFEEGMAIGGLTTAGAAADLALYVPGNLLAYTDIGSMAESLEVRVPFLDPDVAYAALRLLRPAHLSYRKPKKLLRETFADLLPPHVLAGKKRGFNPPLARWMRTTLDPLFDAEATAAFRSEFVNEAELGRMRAAHRSGAEDYAQELLMVLTAARWFKRYYGG